MRAAAAVAAACHLLGASALKVQTSESGLPKIAAGSQPTKLMAMSSSEARLGDASAGLSDTVQHVVTRMSPAELQINTSSQPARRKPPPGPHRQVMQNIGDIEYVTHMKVGNQTITGIMDTGSFELVIFSTKCVTCGKAAKYDPNVSSTHRSEMLMTTMTYGSGDTYSTEGTDVVSIGGLEERNQTFWEVMEARMPILRNAEFQAIIGLGPPETPTADAWGEVRRTIENVNRFFDEGRLPPSDVADNAHETIEAAVELSKKPALLDNFQITTFSVCMGAKPGEDGYFVWSDNSPFERPEVFTRVPVVGKHTWSVALSNVKLTRPGSVTSTDVACGGALGCNALVDSGTSLLAVPHAIVHQIQEMVSKMRTDCDDLRELPNLVFSLGGTMFSLPPDAYVASVADEVPSYLQGSVRMADISLGPRVQGSKKGKCKVLLMESYMDSPEGPLWILGMPFFRKYYTSFHIGDERADRALYIAEATDDCRPAQVSSLARVRPYNRHIDLSRVMVPPVNTKYVGFKKIYNTSKRIQQI